MFKNQKALIMKFLFFDTETTGKLGPDTHIVQLAALLTDEEKPLSQMNVLIKPNNWIIPEEVVAIHGITTEKCEEHGIPIVEALQKLDYLAKQADVVVAHNYWFDCEMVKLERKRLNLLPGPCGATFCTMQASTEILQLPGRFGKFKWPKLQEAYQFFFGEEFEGAHDAMNDVHACSKIFFELRRRGMEVAA